jgi:hypothetical protein
MANSSSSPRRQDDDVRLAAQVAEHDQAAFETLMRRYNSRPRDLEG